MPLKRPIKAPQPGRIRTIPRSFAWIDHGLRRAGLLETCEPEDIGLYLFLVLAADPNGLSCWRLDRIRHEIPCFSRAQLWDARTRLIGRRLIAFAPWSPTDPDGTYQVLPLPDLPIPSRQPMRPTRPRPLPSHEYARK